MSHATHANAVLTPRGRLMLAQLVVEDGWSYARAGERFSVGTTTVRRWVKRYREHGAHGMHDRSSRPRRSPHQTNRRMERRIVGLRVSRRWGPARIAYHLRINPSTVHKVLTRYGCPRLKWTDPATGTRVRSIDKRSYVHEAPGDLIHVDIKKLGRIPAGGGWKKTGRVIGNRNNNRERPGYAFIHHAVDDHSRLAYSEIHADERKETAVEFWQRARAFFAAHGITVKAVLTDNGSCYRSSSGPKPSAPRRSSTDEPGPTGPRPTARSNGSTAPCSRNGPTPRPTPQKPPASRPTPAGSITTITTAATPHTKASHQSPACPTSPDRTASAR